MMTQNADYVRVMADPVTFCVYCGRQMIDVTEPDTLCDPKTGQRALIVWRQCPRFPRNGWQAVWRGCHESYQRDNVIYGREYR